MELSFSTTRLRQICEKRAAATATLGELAAIELAQRLADIEAAENGADLAALLPGDIIDRSPVERSLCLSTGHKLVFRSGHVKTPATLAGATAWEKITRIRVVAIEVDNA